jgi:serine/threonine protein kinase
VDVIPRDIDALRQMVDGLLFIHGKGLIHGAINPDNILICVHNEQIILKISEFGLRK